MMQAVMTGRQTAAVGRRKTLKSRSGGLNQEERIQDPFGFATDSRLPSAALQTTYSNPRNLAQCGQR